MKILLQRVDTASVSINGVQTAAIQSGYLALVGCREGDRPEDADRLAARTASLRIFEDSEGRMNRSVVDVGGAILAVSQFTLYADTRKGNRPSFVQAGDPQKARVLYERYVANLRSLIGANRVRTGSFGADMSIALVNNGPCTIELVSEVATTPTQSPKPKIPAPRLDFLPVESETDIALVQSLVAEIWPICYGDILERKQIDSMLGWMYAPETIRKESAAGTAYFLIAADETPAGICSFDLKPDEEGEIELHKIYTLPQYWSRGLGSLVLREVISRAKSTGASFVYLRVNKNNVRAQKAYAAAGFLRKKAVCSPIQDGFFMDDFIYRKEL